MNADFSLPLEIGGLTFKNPFYVASGPTTKTVRQLIEIERTGWAAASIKLTIDPAPYINRKPRYALFKDRQALAFTAEKRLNMEEGLRLIQEGKKATRDLLLMANITYAGDDGIAGWVRMAKRFEDAGADIIELNMCCPNMSYNVELTSGTDEACDFRTGASMGSDEHVASEVAAAVKQAIRIPLFVKLTPEGGRVAQIAKHLYAVGADAVGSTANRLGIPPINLAQPEKAIYHLQDEISMSCHCSSWLKPLAQRDTYEMRKICGDDVIIAATGGIRNWEDAVEMFMCGANLIGICSETLISGYDFVRPMITGVKQFLADRHNGSLDAIRSIIVPEVKTATELTLHDGYAKIMTPELAAPCKSACPIHVPVQAYIKKVADGDVRGAFDMLMQKSPLQELCAYACDAPCEDACIRSSLDGPVAIRALKKFIFETAEKEGWLPQKTVRQDQDLQATFDDASVENLAAASALVRAGYRVTVRYAGFEPGSALAGNFAETRLPRSVISRVIAQLEREGISFSPDTSGDSAESGDMNAFDRMDVSSFNRLVHSGRLALNSKNIAFYGSAGALLESIHLSLENGANKVTLISKAKLRQSQVAELNKLAGSGVIRYQDISEIEEILHGDVLSGLKLHSSDGFDKTIGCNLLIRSGSAESLVRAMAHGQNMAAAMDSKKRGEEATVVSPRDEKLTTVAKKKVLDRQDASMLAEALTRKKYAQPILDELAAAVEAANRCLRCGCGEGCQLCKTICTDFAPYVSEPDRIAIDPEKCVACGMCYQRCPNQIIDMIRTS